MQALLDKGYELSYGGGFRDSAPRWLRALFSLQSLCISPELPNLLNTRIHPLPDKASPCNHLANLAVPEMSPGSEYALCLGRKSSRVEVV